MSAPAKASVSPIQAGGTLRTVPPAMAAAEQARHCRVYGGSMAGLWRRVAQGCLVDAAERVDRLPRVVHPPVGGLDVEVGFVAGGVRARLVVDHGHRHGGGTEFGERAAGPLSGPAGIVHLVDEQDDLALHVRFVR